MWVSIVCNSVLCFRSHSKYSFRLLADDLGPGMPCHRDAHQSGREGKGNSACTHANIYALKPVYKDHLRDSHQVIVSLWAAGPYMQ